MRVPEIAWLLDAKEGENPRTYLVQGHDTGCPVASRTGWGRLQQTRIREAIGCNRSQNNSCNRLML